MNKVTFIRAPKDLASLLRGLYGRVASRLGLDPSYVSRVARGDRQSELVEGALRREISNILKHVEKQRTHFGQKAPAKKGFKKKARSKPN
jgi:hypothetical protein